MERLTKEGLPWHTGKSSGERRYIVKGPGLALEAILAWDRREGRWRMAAAGRHELLCFVLPGDDVSDEKCELVGGPCEYVGLPLEVQDALDRLGDARNPSVERPEAFWKALEALTVGGQIMRSAPCH